MVCSPPGSSVHRIFQAKIIDHVAMPSSRESSQPGKISNSCLLHWQAVSLLMIHQGSPTKEMKPKQSHISFLVILIYSLTTSTFSAFLVNVILKPWKQTSFYMSQKVMSFRNKSLRAEWMLPPPLKNDESQ